MALPLIKNPLPKDPSKSNAVFLYPCASAELINLEKESLFNTKSF